MITENWVKVLRSGGLSPHQLYPYYLPKQREDGSWKPGKWMPARPHPRYGAWGWHITKTPYDRVTHRDCQFWLVEVKRAYPDSFGWNAVANSVRLIEPIPHQDWWFASWQRVDQANEILTRGKAPEFNPDLHQALQLDPRIIMLGSASKGLQFSWTFQEGSLYQSIERAFHEFATEWDNPWNGAAETLSDALYYFLPHQRKPTAAAHLRYWSMALIPGLRLSNEQLELLDLGRLVLQRGYSIVGSVANQIVIEWGGK